MTTRDDKETTGVTDDTNRRRNLGYFFDDTVARLPDKVAIIDLWGGRERESTYGRLDERMNRVAAALARLGVVQGDRVGMLCGNRTEFIEFFFGTMRLGAIPVPLNTRLGDETLDYIFRDAGCVAALVDPGCNPKATEIAGAIDMRFRLLLDETDDGFLSYEAELAVEAPVPPPPPLDDDAQAFQPYTSGSTGRPKGAIMTHRGMLWYVHYNQKYWPASSDDRGLIALPLFHKNALRGTVKPQLFAGGSFVLMPAYDPMKYLDALSKYRCTYSRGVAAVFTMFLQHREYIENLDLSALKSMAIGSAVVAPELLEAVGKALPGVTISESYGLTEGGSPLRAPLDGRKVPVGSVGVPAPEIELKLVAPDGSEDTDEGELVIRCPYVCLGYHNQPEVTAQKIQDGWLRTGDVFYRAPDGFFFFRSRVDDMFSCGGENIYPKEVENLLFSHPDVSDTVVTPVSHAVKGLAPAAMVVPRDGASVTADDLKAFCLEKGPAYAHPRLIEVVPALPLNGAGKIDRNAVRAMLDTAYQKVAEDDHGASA